MPVPANENGSSDRHFPLRRPFGSRWILRNADPDMRVRDFARMTMKGLFSDRVFGHAAELGFYFLFSLFPALFCATSALGLMARSAHQISDRLLGYLALVIPNSAMGTVLGTFNQTAAAASTEKVTFGSIMAIWSASVGISAIQDTLNEVFGLKERRSYLPARFEAILLTFLMIVVIGSALACVFGGDFMAAIIDRNLGNPTFSGIVANAIRVVAWVIAACLLALSFAILYYCAPNWPKRQWRLRSPGIVIGITVWLLASLGLRLYLHYFNNYTVTYGSLGAVIILLTWFYISGFSLLLGAEIDKVAGRGGSEIRNKRPPPPIAISPIRRKG